MTDRNPKVKTKKISWINHYVFYKFLDRIVRFDSDPRSIVLGKRVSLTWRDSDKPHRCPMCWSVAEPHLRSLLWKCSVNNMWILDFDRPVRWIVRKLKMDYVSRRNRKLDRSI